MYFRKDLNGSYQTALCLVMVVKRERSSRTETIKLFSCQAASWHFSTVSQTQSAPRIESWICCNRILTWLLLWLCHSEGLRWLLFWVTECKGRQGSTFPPATWNHSGALAAAEAAVGLWRKGFGDRIETSSINWNPKGEWFQVTKLDWERFRQ